MVAKLGRNQLCWCKSGKKYKHCHLDREVQVPIKPWEADKALRQAFSVPMCSAPNEWLIDCEGEIIKAHTVPRSGSLNKIAHNGHVLAFVPSLQNFTKNKGNLKPDLLGINRASTFTGFCGKHDNAIFSPVETTDFTGTPEQCFLLGYRAVARELYTKESSLRASSLRAEADKGRNYKAQIAIQNFNNAFDFGLGAGNRDIRRAKAQYDHALSHRDYSKTRAYVLLFDDPPSVMCSAGWFPSVDFEGGKLQDLSDLSLSPQLLTCTSFWGGTKGAIVFQWFGEKNQTCETFVRSLHRIDDAKLTSSLLRMMFEYFENIFIAPKWWNSLSETMRKSLTDRMLRSANPFTFNIPNPLKEDNLQFPNWSYLKRYSVGFDL